MNETLTYKLVYSPKASRSQDAERDVSAHIRRDGRINVRLRKYGAKRERILGFKDKLRFLVTYLAWNCVKRHVGDGESTDYQRNGKVAKVVNAVNSVAEGSDMDALVGSLRWHCMRRGLKGIEVSLRCCREAEDDEVTRLVGGMVGLEDRPSASDPMREFAKEFLVGDVSVAEFLTDDGYSIEIGPEPTVPAPKCAHCSLESQETCIW